MISDIFSHFWLECIIGKRQTFCSHKPMWSIKNRRCFVGKPCLACDVPGLMLCLTFVNFVWTELIAFQYLVLFSTVNLLIKRETHDFISNHNHLCSPCFNTHVKFYAWGKHIKDDFTASISCSSFHDSKLNFTAAAKSVNGSFVQIISEVISWTVTTLTDWRIVLRQRYTTYVCVTCTCAELIALQQQK